MARHGRISISPAPGWDRRQPRSIKAGSPPSGLDFSTGSLPIITGDDGPRAARLDPRSMMAADAQMRRGSAASECRPCVTELNWTITGLMAIQPGADEGREKASRCDG